LIYVYLLTHCFYFRN